MDELKMEELRVSESVKGQKGRIHAREREKAH